MKKYLVLLTTMIVVLLSVSKPTLAATSSCTLYTSPSGNSAYDGRSLDYATTIQKAVQSAIPGDTVCLLGGTYKIAAPLLPARPNQSDPDGQWVVYRNYDSTRPILQWAGGDVSGSDIFKIDGGTSFSNGKKYIEINGLVLDGQNPDYATDVNLVHGGIFCRYSHHLRFVNNLIKNTGESGIATKSCDYLTADHNQIFHNGYTTGWSSGISYNSQKWLEGFLGTPRNYGFHSFVTNNIISGQTDNSTNHTDGNGIIMDLTNDTYSGLGDTPPVLVANNLVYQNGGRCIEAYFVSDIWVVNNTCYKNTLDNRLLKNAGDQIGEYVVNSSQNIYFVNNLAYIWNNTAKGTNSHVAFQVINNSTASFWANMYYGEGNGGTNSLPFTPTASQIAHLNPTFVNPPLISLTLEGQYANAIAPDLIGNRLALTASSLGIDAGSDPEQVSEFPVAAESSSQAYLDFVIHSDIMGVSRPLGNGVDIGAFENTAAQPTVATNTPTAHITPTPANTPTSVPTSIPAQTPVKTSTTTPLFIPLVGSDIASMLQDSSATGVAKAF